MVSIIFFGSFGKYSVQVLEKLIKHFTVLSVVTVPPRPKGRHLTLTKSDVQLFAEKNNIPVLTDLKSLPSEKPDFLLVAGYGQLIPKNWLEFPKISALNLHPSLLPKYRGPCPAEWAILNGETETGVTLIKMDEKFDLGEIFGQENVQITPTDTKHSLYSKLFDKAADMAIELLPQIASGELKSHPQSGPPSHARKLSRQDGFVPFEQINTPETERKIRAFGNWPGVWTFTPNNKRLKILSPTLVQLEGKNPEPWSTYF